MPDAYGRISKPCRKCGIDKPIEAFHVNLTYGSGRDARCAECQIAYQKSLKAKPEFKAKLRQWEIKSKRKSLYGLTEEDYAARLEAQGGVCALCGKPPRGGVKGKHLHVDHDHVTHKVRGLLCRPCNQALGQLGDSVWGLMKAIEYVLGQKLYDRD